MARAPRPSWLYFLVAVLSWPIVKAVFRYRARDVEKVPAEGGFVLAANHSSNFDPWPLGLPLFPRRFLRFMAKSPLVPAAVAGTDRLARLGPLRVRYGDAIELGDLRELEPAEAAQVATERLQRAIGELEESLA
jgi:1-acyl-sn-glycerol-3-phosphate acyltransferase